MLNAPFRLSVAIPVYNEEQVFPELLRRTCAVLDQLPGGPHELVVVDDGSSDRTPELLRAAAARDPRIVGIALSRNFGHQAALSAALDAVSGDATVIMDGDLQDAPEVIPRFLDELRNGCDVVYARRVRRKESWWLRLAYRAYYRLLSRLADVQLPLDAGDFGLMSRRVVELIRQTPERHRYLRGLRSWVGFRQAGIDVERDARQAGKSKYSLAKLVRLGCDGIFSFSTMPLRAAAVLGALGVGASTLFAAYAVFVRVVLHRGPQGFTALILVITFLSGLNLFFLGVIGEYVGRVFEQVKGRPTYVVGEITRQRAPDAEPPAREPVRGAHAVLPPPRDAVRHDSD